MKLKSGHFSAAAGKGGVISPDGVARWSSCEVNEGWIGGNSEIRARSLIRDKPFGKGNTQTGIALTLAFLLRNGAMVVAPEEEIAGVGLGIAQGEVYAGMVEMWLRDSVRPAW